MSQFMFSYMGTTQPLCPIQERTRERVNKAACAIETHSGTRGEGRGAGAATTRRSHVTIPDNAIKRNRICQVFMITLWKRYHHLYFTDEKISY